LIIFGNDAHARSILHIERITFSSACLPYLLSILNRLKSRVSVARRSPCVKAPKHSNRFATLYQRKEKIDKLRI